MLLTPILTLLPLLSGVAGSEGRPLLVDLSRRGTPAAHLAKRQDANATEAAGPAATDPGIIPTGNHTESNNTTVGNPHGSASGTGDTGASAGRGVGHAPLSLVGNSILTLNISVGTPPQEIPVAFTLGEKDNNLKIAACGATCIDEVANGGLAPMFNPGASSSYKTENKTVGSANGTVAADNVTVAGVTIQDQPFLLQTDRSAQLSATISGYAGILNLGLQGDNSSLGGQSFLRTLAKSWRSPQFGLYVAPWSNAQTQMRLDNSGELALGGLNRELYTGNVTYVDTVGEGWTVPLTSVQINGNTITGAGNGTAQRRQETTNNTSGGNTAAPFIGARSYISDSLAQALVANIPGANSTEQSQINVPCDTNLTLTLNIGGYVLDLPSALWIAKTTNETGQSGAGCSALFETKNATWDGAQLGMGLNILQSTYTAFKIGNSTAGEASQIGFAKLSDAAKGHVPAAPGNSTGNSTGIPGATENPAVTATGAGVSASAPAGTGTTSSAGHKVGISVVGVLVAAALAFTAL